MNLLARALQELRNWWRRPCGGREVWQLAWPLILSTSSWTLMHFVDRVFLTWYSPAAIAGSMPAGVLHYTLLCLPQGIAAYVNAFVSQYKGANLPERIGRVVWQGIWIGVISTPLFLASIPLAPVIFGWARHEAAITEQEVIYFQALAFGAGGSVIAMAMSSFFTGLRVSRVVMIVDMAAALFNVVFDYLWIFGHGGFPELGAMGAALATSLAQWLRVVAFGAVMLKPKYRRTYHLAKGCRWDGPLMRRLLWFGGPSGIQQFVEMTAFTIFLFILGTLGEMELAVTNIAFSVNAIAFLPMLGLGTAVITIVGQYLGANRVDLAERATWTSLWLGWAYTGLMAVLFIFVPDLFLAAHASGSGESFEQLRPTCHILLRFVAAYCLWDMTHLVFIGAIKGAGDTRFIMLTTLIIAPVPVALAHYGVRYGGWHLNAFWLVITGWICLLGAIYFLRFQWGPWRRLRVIEPLFVADVVLVAPLAAAE